MRRIIDWPANLRPEPVADAFSRVPAAQHPELVAIILREAPPGRRRSRTARARLQALLDARDEHPPFGPEEVASRLEMLIRYLTEARLLARGTRRQLRADRARPRGAGRASAGLRYRRPDGLPGVRPLHPRPGAPARAVRRARRRLRPGLLRLLDRREPGRQPLRPDSADHLAWENGWSEALDEDFRWTGPRFAPEP